MGGQIGVLVLAALMLLLVVGGTSLFIGGVSNEYVNATNVSSDNFDYFNKSAGLYNMTDSMATNIQNEQSSSTDLLDIPYLLVTSGFESVKIMFSAGDILISLVTGFDVVAASIGVPIGWAISIIMTIIMVVVTFAIIAIVLKWELM